MHKARAGHHLTPARLWSDRDVYEELGRGFTLLAFDAGEAATAAFTQAAQTAGVPLKVVRDSYAEGREAYEAPLVLVRPDQYVVWVGERAPDDTGALLARVTGRR
jgi:hypothetical protein